MRQWGRMVVVSMALAAGVACAARGRMGYPPRDRHAMAVLIPVHGCSVIGGPETHIAFPGKKVTWRVINLCDDDVELEVRILERNPTTAPENPFVEDLARGLAARRGTGTSNGFNLTIKGAGAFPDGVENQYKYRLQIKGRADSGIDPELDIWR